MKEKLKDTLVCGYYDEDINNYIVELDENKLDQLLKEVFHAKSIILVNGSTENLRKIISEQSKEIEELKNKRKGW